MSIHFKLVVGGSYTPPPTTAMNMQLGDDPLLAPKLSNIQIELDSLAFDWLYPDHGYNPQATPCKVYKWNGTNWVAVSGELQGSGTFTESSLLEGTNHKYALWVITELSPTPKIAGQEADLWTDYMLEIIETKDAGGSTLEGALVIAIPAEQMMNLISATDEGQDWPTLGFKRCNRVDSYGRCSIRIPGGWGAAAVLMIPTQYPTTGGDILAPVKTQEEA